MACNARNTPQTTCIHDCPDAVRITRRAHVFEGQLLKVVRRARRDNQSQFLLLFPDGSQRYVPVDWTDAGTAGPVDTRDTSGLPTVGLWELQQLRARIEWIRQRTEAVQDSPAGPSEPSCALSAECPPRDSSRTQPDRSR